MKKRYLFSVIIIVILISLTLNVVLFIIGCRRIDWHHFTKHDSLYFEIYDTLNSYTFETNNGIDTLIIKEKYVHEDYRKWFFSEVEDRTFNAYAHCEGILKHDGFEEEVYISYSKMSDQADPLMRIILAERYAMDINDDRNILKTGIYKDTIIVDSINSHQNFGFLHHFTFKSFKWHKYKGIVGYELSDGTIYLDKNGDTD